MLNIRKILSNKYILRNTFQNISGNYSKRFKSKSAPKLDEKCFAVERVTPDDYNDIVDLFRESYFKTEPTLVGAGLANKFNPVLENKLLCCLSEGLSLKVRCKGDKSIVGVAVNSTLCPWDPDLDEEYARKCCCKKTAKLLKFYAHVSRAPNLWCKYCETKIFEITYLTTRIADRGRLIGYTLVKKSLDHGKDMSYNILRIDATSRHTQRICDNLGMKMIYEIPYNKYCSSDGKVFIQAPPPHCSLKVYVVFPHSEEEAMKNRKKIW